MGKISDMFADATPTPKAGDTAHCVHSGLVVSLDGGGPSGARNVVLSRGQSFVITAAMLDAARDRFGNLSGWAAMLHDEDAQVRTWGRVQVRPGPWPEDAESWEHGSPEWEMARDAARRHAYALPEAERAEALAEVTRRYGSAASTSKTTATYSAGEHPTERAARAQAEAFAADRAAGRR